MRIGISARSIVVNNKESFILYKRYIEHFKESEVILLLPNQSLEVLDLCDVFLLTGGDDLNPILYGQENISSNGVDDDIDFLDLIIIDHAYKNGKKILGICRGIQSINVYFGGTLKQHHDNHMEVLHKIHKNHCNLKCDLGEEIIVNSYHHQVIDKLGANLICTYISVDGIVEVIEHINGKVAACQYHPEIKPDDNSKVLFDFLLSN